MKIELGLCPNGKLGILNLSHRGEEDEWNVDTYGRSTLQNIGSLFNNINGFLTQLNPELQDQIWNQYVRIKQHMDTISDPLRLHQAVQKEVAELYRLVSFDDLKKWVRLHGIIGAPEDLKADYSDVNNELTRRLTYLRDDYYDLAVMSTLLKLMVPIFGEYIRRMGKEVGTKFKEHYAFSLLGMSSFVKLAPFHRLRDYVEARTINEERKNPSGFRKNSAIFGGLGTAELPDWLLSRAVVRRVAIHEEAVGDNIVANVYHAVEQQISSLDKTFNGRVNEKRLFGGQTEEENVSVAENYKVKQPISDGDLCVLSIYTEQRFDMAGRVDPTFDREKLERCTEAAHANPYIRICTHHITLAQWTLAKAISPRGIPSLNKPALLMALAVTQSLLWHWGFRELAILMLAEPSSGVSMGASTPPTRLSKQRVDEFTELYPYYQRLSNSVNNPRGTNVACRAIDILTAELIQRDWVVKGPQALMVEHGLTGHDVNYVISAEIRQELAELVKKVNALRQFELGGGLSIAPAIASRF